MDDQDRQPPCFLHVEPRRQHRSDGRQCGERLRTVGAEGVGERAAVRQAGDEYPVRVYRVPLAHLGDHGADRDDVAVGLLDSPSRAVRVRGQYDVAVDLGRAQPRQQIVGARAAGAVQGDDQRPTGAWNGRLGVLQVRGVAFRHVQGIAGVCARSGTVDDADLGDRLRSLGQRTAQGRRVRLSPEGLQRRRLVAHFVQQIAGADERRTAAEYRRDEARRVRPGEYAGGGVQQVDRLAPFPVEGAELRRRGEGVRLGAQPGEAIAERLCKFGLHGGKPVRVQIFLDPLEGVQEIQHYGFLPCNGRTVVVRGLGGDGQGRHEDGDEGQKPREESSGGHAGLKGTRKGGFERIVGLDELVEESRARVGAKVRVTSGFVSTGSTNLGWEGQ